MLLSATMWLNLLLGITTFNYCNYLFVLRTLFIADLAKKNNGKAK